MREVQWQRQTAIARRVAAWPDAWGADGCDGVCRNASDEPVFDVRLQLNGIGLIPDESSHEVLEVRRIAVLAPAEEQRFAFDCQLDETRGVPLLTLSFVDCAGRRWERLPNGRLRQSEAAF